MHLRVRVVLQLKSPFFDLLDESQVTRHVCTSKPECSCSLLRRQWQLCPILALRSQQLAEILPPHYPRLTDINDTPAIDLRIEMFLHRVEVQDVALQMKGRSPAGSIRFPIYFQVKYAEM